MTMAISLISPNLPDLAPNKIDHLSNLPDDLLVTILSFLSTRIAARTSVLSRRFRHLWEASPSFDLDQRDFNYPPREKFLAMADRVFIILRQNPSHPLLSFRLDHFAFASDSIISSLLFKACSFSLRHLTIESCYFRCIRPLLPVIFSIKSLQSLSLTVIAPMTPWPDYKKDDYVLPSATSLTCLTTLSIQKYAFHPDRTTELNQLLSRLPSLQELQLGVCQLNEIDISSHTIRKLKLIILYSTGMVPIVILRLSLPLLESLHLQNDVTLFQFPTIHAEIPLLKKVVLNLNDLCKEDVFAVNGLLHHVSHAEELIMHMKESENEIHPFPILLEQGECPPNFPKLKHLDVSMCFHEDTFQSIVSMLQQSPALESVRLIHELPKFTRGGKLRKRKDWKSMLPRNADRNYRYICFNNLHLWENREEFMKLLSKNRPSKKQARN